MYVAKTFTTTIDNKYDKIEIPSDMTQNSGKQFDICKILKLAIKTAKQ